MAVAGWSGAAVLAVLVVGVVGLGSFTRRLVGFDVCVFKVLVCSSQTE